MIQCATWSRHNHINTAFQGHELGPDRRTTIDGEDGDSLLFTIALDGLGHLYSQFARRHQNEGGRMCLRHQMSQALEKRQGKRGRFACSRRRATEEVASVQERWDRFALDWRRFLISQGL
jgi:hypothetical protein